MPKATTMSDKKIKKKEKAARKIAEIAKGNKKGNKITEGTALADVLKNPGLEEVLAKHNLPCLHCPMASYEMGSLKIGDVARTYGIEVSGLLKELNEKNK